MKKKLSVALAIAAITPFGIVACGDDDDESSDDSAATTEETTTEETTTEASTGEGSTVAFTADPDGGLAFEESSAEAEAGAVTVELTNESSTPHDVQIEGADGDLGGTETVTGGTTSASVDLEAGDYTFYCSVSGHREAGMEGDLTVE